MATFSLLVISAPSASQNAHSALRFAQMLAKSEHVLTGVFFYFDGVHNANKLQMSMADEKALYSAWCDLAEQLACPLLVCVSAANKRGVLSQTDAIENDLSQFTLDKPFESVGLGEFSALLHQSDRLIQF